MSNRERHRPGGVWQSLCSTRLTIVLLIAIAVVSTLGTFIPQNAEEKVYWAQYGATLYKLLEFTGATNLYRSWWFVTLLALLGLNILICTFNKLSFRVKSLGSFLTHISIMAILVGAIVGGIWGEKGLMKIHEGQTTNIFYAGKKYLSLSFQINLEDFAIEHYSNPQSDVLGEILSVRNMNAQTNEIFPVVVGKEYQVKGTDYTVKIKRLVPDFLIDLSTREVTSRSEQPNNPAIEISVTGPEGESSGWLFSRYPAMNTYKKNIGLELTYARTVPEAIKDYKSKLKVIEDEQVVAAKTIEVNDPLRYRGYTFYQYDYDRDNFSYTVLQVVKDPGIPIVYAGFILLLLGLTYTYAVKPLLKKSSPSERDAPRQNPPHKGGQR